MARSFPRFYIHVDLADRRGEAFVQQLRPELAVRLSCSLALPRGPLDLSLDASVWTVSGDRTRVTSSGILTRGENTGALGGEVGLAADLTLGDGWACQR